MALIQLSSVRLLLLVVMATEFTYGIKLSMDFETFPSRDDGPHSQVTCTGTGNDYNIYSLSVNRMEASGTSLQLLALSSNSPSNDVIFGNVRGTGTIEKNLAHAKLKLFSASPDIPENFFTCQAKFVNESGALEDVFTMVGPGIGNLPARWPETENTEPLIDAETRRVIPTGSLPSSISVSELEYLSSKVSRLEQKMDRLDDKIGTKLHRQGQRLGHLEDNTFVKVGTMETNLSTRLSRLEDKFSAISTYAQPETDGVGKVESLEQEITALKALLDQRNGSEMAAVGKDEPTVCERGMGDDVTKDYPRYAVLRNDVVNRSVLCDTHTDGGGWIVFQRRARGDVDFYRDWTSYREGFGSLTGDFWLGNEAVHRLTDAAAYELRVDIREKGKEVFALYLSFRLENEADKYRLKIGSFTGTAVDRLTAQHKNMAFSTFDRDNDVYGRGACAVAHHGAWWYGACHDSNLNGYWGLNLARGNTWHNLASVSFSEMKIRRIKGPATA